MSTPTAGITRRTRSQLPERTARNAASDVAQKLAPRKAEVSGGSMSQANHVSVPSLGP